jgi:hypothetical protein
MQSFRKEKNMERSLAPRLDARVIVAAAVAAGIALVAVGAFNSSDQHGISCALSGVVFFGALLLTPIMVAAGIAMVLRQLGMPRKEETASRVPPPTTRGETSESGPESSSTATEQPGEFQ